MELHVPYGADAAVANIAKFLGVVEHATKTRCVLYLGYYFWQGALGSTTGFSGHPLWLAQYDGGTAPPQIPSAWSDWTFWQYTDRRAVNGVSGGVDADKFHGELDDLRKLAIL